MKRKEKFLNYLLLGICICVVSVFLKSNVIVADENTDEVKIGVTLAGEDASYQILLAKYLQQEAQKQKVDLTIVYASWDADIQIEQMTQFMEDGEDAIVLCPVNAKSMLNILKMASKADIPVIDMNMKVDAISTEYITTYVGASSTEEAVLAAQMAGDALGGQGGKIGIIEGTPGTDPQIYRTQGFFDAIASQEELNVVAIGEGDWNRDRAYKQALSMMIQNPDLAFIYAQDSEMAMGAVQAIEEKNLMEQIQVIGIGEGSEYADAVREGTLYGFVYQDAVYEAQQAIDSALAASEGEKQRPWYRNAVSIITAENVDLLEE